MNDPIGITRKNYGTTAIRILQVIAALRYLTNNYCHMTVEAGATNSVGSEI